MTFKISLRRLLANHPFLYDLYVRSLASVLAEKRVEADWARKYRIAKNHLLETDSRIIEMEGIKLEIDPSSNHDLLFYYLWLNGLTYEKETVRILSDIAKGRSVFVDVGANSGFYSLLASKIMGEAAKIYSFEPWPNSYARLLNNVRLNGFRNIFTYRTALGDREESRVMYSYPLSDGQNSLVKIPNARAHEIVQVKRLDDVLPDAKVDVIKIDVEGFELNVLKGATNILKRNHQIVCIMEFSMGLQRLNKIYPHEIFNFLKTLGFRFFWIGDELLEFKGSGDIPGVIGNMIVTRRLGPI
ncbi:MAG: FkbM family methyltransferase [Conexivisphaerales archaeon]